MNNLHPSSASNNIERRDLGNGTIEEIQTMPKNQYYASLRMGSNASLARNSNTFNRSASNNALSGRYGSSILNKAKSSQAIFKPSGKMKECAVTLLDGTSHTFSIDSASLGIQLMDEVATHLDLAEKEFFCLQYRDTAVKTWFWLKMDKKISEQLTKIEWQFDFQVKFFPPHMENIIEDITRYYFCLQIRQDIIADKIQVSFNILVLLSAYAVQSEAGMYDVNEHKGIEYLRAMPFAPVKQQTDELLIRINDMHKILSYLSPEEADQSFMWNAIKLGMYGIDFHKVKTTQNEEVQVGVYHSGILVYRGKVRVIRYRWAKILNLSYKNKSFFVKIRATDLQKKEQIVEFRCTNQKLSKRLYLACKEHHEFFRMIDAENPKKPQLMPGYGTRKYQIKTGDNNGRSDSVPTTPTTPHTPNIILNRPQPKVRRAETKRKEVSLSMSGVAPTANVDDLGNNDEMDENRPDLTEEYWKMLVHDSTPELGIDQEGLDVAANEGAPWQGCRANRGVKGPGKFYYEGKVLEDGLIRLGWTTNDGSLNLGSDDKGWGYGDNQAGDRQNNLGHKKHSNQEENYGEAIHEGDTIGCMVDFDSGKVQWTKNGINYGPGYTLPEQIREEALFPTSSIKDGRVIFNFGDDPMEFMPKGGYVPLAKANNNNVVPNINTGWKLNPFDSTNDAVVSGNGLSLQTPMNGQWNGSRANKGVFDSGKYYYEVIPLEDGLARIGWATDQGSLMLGTDAAGFGYGADEDGFGISGNQGKKLHDGIIDNYGQPFDKGQVIGCYIDLDNKLIKWSKDGQVFEEAYDIPDDLLQFHAFYPCASLLNNTLDFNFGEKPFRFHPGDKWLPVCFAANGNTEHSKRMDPSLFHRPNVDRREDVMELRRQKRDDLRRAQKDKELSDKRDREHRALLQKQREEEEALRLLQQKQKEEADRLRRQQEAERLRRQQEAAAAEQHRLEQEELERRRRQQEQEESERRRQMMEKTETEESYQTMEVGDPEVTTETYVDEQGRTVTRTIKKRKIISTTNVQRNFIERSEDETNRSSYQRIQMNKESSIDDDEFLEAILFVTKFSGDVTVMEGVKDVALTSN